MERNKMLNTKQMKILRLIDNDEPRASYAVKTSSSSQYVSLITKLLLIGGYIFKRSPYGLTAKGKEILNGYNKEIKSPSGV